MLEYFSDPYPDELLYSVWARLGDLVHYRNRSDTSKELFGGGSNSLLVDWSCSLGYLMDQLPADHCYTVDMLINKHTLFPLYAPFLPTGRRQRIRDQMVSGDGRRFSARLGILTSHIPVHTWLRFCPECARRDRERFGETYWHRLHQAPGVLVCPEHETFLEDSDAARRSGKKSFLSAEGVVHPCEPRSAAHDPLCQLMLDIAECIDQMLQGNYASPEEQFLRNQYRTLLELRGLITVKGSLRIVELLKAFSDYYPPTLLSLLHCELNRTKHIEAEWPARLPYGREPQHPLHHILVIRFLGATIDAFLGSLFSPRLPFGDRPWPCLNPVCEQYRVFCIARYEVRAHSPKGRTVGLFACPSCGFTYCRAGPDRSPEDIFRRDRIPSYGHVWEAKLRQWWLDPEMSTSRIARCLGADFRTVKIQAQRLALPPRGSTRSVVGAARPLDQQALAEKRAEWLQFVERHAPEGITALLRRRKRARIAYDWLNKHDREWLRSHLPPRKIAPKTKARLRTTFRFMIGTSDKSRREERDAHASEAIIATARQITDSPGEPRRVTRAQLEKVVPGAGWMFSNPERYPLTWQAFKEAKETREAFALRRIGWALQTCRDEGIRPTRKEFIIRAGAKDALNLRCVRTAIEEALALLASI